ncbi:MAG TPA: hypothetical protein VMX13_07355 [Sedimentisphaerales bacterium]|nr:hypothetical protein [Sedimentisphaerales bacterium]
MIKILPGPFGKMLAVFRGQVSPVFIFLSVLLGFWFGLTPGWSGLHAVLVVVVLLLNIHLGLFLLAAGLGKALCFAAAPILYHMGVWVHNYLPALLGLLASAPVIGVTDFNKYSVAGALVIGPVIGGAAGLLLASAVIRFRRMLLKFEEGSEKFKKWYSNPWVHVLDRLLVGKRTKDAKSLFTAKTKIIRKAGVILAAAALAVSVFAATLLKDNVIKDYVAATMTQANGAEVDLDGFRLSPLAGAASVSGIQVTDSKEPQKNQVYIGNIGADISLYDLLLGRLVMEQVEVSDVRFDQVRAVPGKVVRTDAEPKAPLFDPCDFKLEQLDIAKIETYFKDAKAVRQWLQKVRNWLPKPREKADATRLKEIPQKYLEYLQARVPAPMSPRILGKSVLFDKVEMGSELFGESEISLENISDSPRAARLPVTLRIKSHDTPALLSVTFDYSSPEKGPLVSGTFDGFHLDKIQQALGPNAGLVFGKGTASGRFDGQVTSESADLTVKIDIRDMDARAQGQGILGLGPETTSQALEVLQNLTTTMRVVGPVSEPRVSFDVKGLGEQFKNALVKAGKQRLAEEIDKQIGGKLDGKLKDTLPKDVKDVLKSPEDLTKRLKGLLGGKSDKKENNP